MSERETVHIVDQIEVYLSDGLGPAERVAFESHAAGCPVCARALAEARRADATLRDVFVEARPAADLEDRVIRGLRQAPQLRLPTVHPIALRSAAAVAAAVLLTGSGIVVSSAVERGGLFVPWSNRASASEHSYVSSNLQQIGKAVGMYSHDFGNAPESLPAVAFNRSIQRELHDDISSPNAADRTTVQKLEQEVRQLSEAGRWSEAHEADVKLLKKDPGNQFGYSLKSQIEYKEGLRAYYAEPSQSGQSPSAGAAKDVKDKETTLGATVTNTLYGKNGTDDTYSYRPSQELAKLGDTTAGLSVATNAPALGNDRDGKAGDKPVQVPPSAGFQAGGSGPAGPAPAPVSPPQKPAPNPADNPPPVLGRKIIRNGTMEIEVERFDDSLMRITKLVNEQDGFIATTDSEKLPNGKVKGTITVRVPPQHLDSLVLTLRGIGDLKSQKITAEDVTKHYTDLESELRAAKAMEKRLLEIIKTGKGQIKDLLQAEKELGVWREKIEQIVGEQRYLDNLIAYSTLSLELYEKDIKTPASASETEQVSMSLETEKVDDAYGKARDIVAAAKGRIVQSELKQYDAGQFGAVIQAAIPPDAAEEAIARLRQLSGRIAHFSRERHQTTQNGAAAPADNNIKVQREDVVLQVQIYNLANIKPRRTTIVKIAAANVESAYHKIVDDARAAGGRIVTSSIARPDANQQTADLVFEVPSDKADNLQDELRGLGELMRQDSAENPDTPDVTDAKRGFHLTIVSLAAAPARETQDVRLAAASVPQAFNDILSAVKSVGGRVLQSNLNEQDRQNVVAAISFEIGRGAAEGVEAAMGKTTQVLTRTIDHSPDTENTVDTKLHVKLSIQSAQSLSPRQIVTISQEVSDVQRAVDDVANAAASAGGRRIGSGEMSQDRAGHVTARVVVDVPLDKAAQILDELDRSGYRRSKQVAFDSAVPDGPLARARIDATFSNSAASLGGEESTWDAIRHGLAISGTGLRWSLQYLIVGLCFVAPWVAAIWAIWRLARRRTPTPATVPAGTGPS